MNKTVLFEKNLRALADNQESSGNNALCSRLAAAQTVSGAHVYAFLESKSGETVPAMLRTDGSARPLHSMVDPRREAERLMSTLKEEGFLVFPGLGGGFAPAEALRRETARRILVVDYGYRGIAELLREQDYSGIFGDPRFCLLIDPDPADIEGFITHNYLPALQGGIRVFPLPPRTENEPAFSGALTGIRRAIDACTRDYSVQAWFGKRWFSNIMRNLPAAEQSRHLPSASRAAITAAGPSLDGHLPMLRKERNGLFLIATDTSFPALLNAGIEPDGILSIDCQHTGYQHFFTAPPRNTIVFLDLASPHVMVTRTENYVFCAGNHPLARYICPRWLPLPALDTSGANVTSAAVSLAKNLGAEEITLYGADFSYPEGKTYARGTYIYPFFEKKQNRFFSMEAQHSAFLYRTALEKRITHSNTNGASWRYETQLMNSYRAALEHKAALTGACIHRGKNGTVKIILPGVKRQEGGKSAARRSAAEIIASYKEKLEALSSFDAPETESRNIVYTMLPAAAAIRRLHPSINTAGTLFTKTREWCFEEMERVLR
jgi:hypothetical protein